MSIHFLEKQENKFFYRSGGGVTSQSNCSEEYQELLDKIYVPLFESIRVDQGEVHFLNYHQDRLELSYLQFYKRKCTWSLETMLLNLPTTGLFKLRFFVQRPILFF